MKAKDNLFSRKNTLSLRGNLVDLSTPLVMGILNISPDSFYDGGRHSSESLLLVQAEKMLQEGATIIDVGGYSSRPMAKDISPKEECKRVLPAIEALVKHFPEINISIDTFRAEVAEQAVKTGACMINDISAGELDAKMFETVARLQLPYVMMHMRGTPKSMQSLTQYDDLLLELIDYFQKKIAQLRILGLRDIIIDPGFGFAKTIPQNYEILKKLDYFEVLEVPLLSGLSRKSMIYKSLDTSPEDALNGTAVLKTLSLTKGTSILRVHDVKEAVEAVKLFKLTIA